MFSQRSASPAVITLKPLAAADRVISYLFADSGLGLLNRIAVTPDDRTLTGIAVGGCMYSTAGVSGLQPWRKSY